MRRTIYLILSLISVACESDFDLDLNTQQSLIMTSFIERGSAIDVAVYGSISYTDSTLSTSAGEVSVELSMNGKHVNTKHLGASRNAVTFDAPELDYLDTICISATTSTQSIEASTVLLRPVAILDVDTVRSRISGTETYTFTLRFHDPQATKDYYQLLIRRRDVDENGDTQRDTTISCDYTDYVFVDAAQDLIGNVLTSSGMFDDELIAGKTYTLTFTIAASEFAVTEGLRPVADIYFYHHTYDYYTYLHSVASTNYTQISSVFGLVEAHTNVVGGYGIVSAMSYDLKSLRIGWSDDEVEP